MYRHTWAKGNLERESTSAKARERERKRAKFKAQKGARKRKREDPKKTRCPALYFLCVCPWRVYRDRLNGIVQRKLKGSN
jgi:hypothetical protein